MKVQLHNPVAPAAARSSAPGTIYVEEDDTVSIFLDDERILGIETNGSIWIRSLDAVEIISDSRTYTLAPDGFKVTLIQSLEG